MSDPSPAPMAGSGPVRSPSTATLRAQSDAQRHAIMLQRCFDGPEMRWSDALIARMRRHLGGCLASVETRMRLEMERLAPALFSGLSALSEPCCWLVVQRQPTLICAPLLDHFRDRAALSLMQQDALHAMPPGAGEEVARPPPEIAELLATIALAQVGWTDSGPDTSPMRADLPAELMAELVWTVAAMLVDGIAANGSLPARQAMTLAERAGIAVLASHDEQNMPFATAALLAHRARAAGIGDAGLLHLARERQILPQLAIVADRAGIELLTLVRKAIEESEQAMFILCRAADFPREVAVRLVLGRRSVVRGVDDSMLVEYADGYQAMTVEAAREAVTALRLPEPLRVRLSPPHVRTDADDG